MSQEKLLGGHSSHAQSLAAIEIVREHRTAMLYLAPKAAFRCHVPQDIAYIHGINNGNKTEGNIREATANCRWLAWRSQRLQRGNRL
jgi:hypothetical protein